MENTERERERERERGLMKFALNAATDTLPHNSNLALWRRSEGFSSNCKLCGKRQTLLHVLNDCPVALELTTGMMLFWRYLQSSSSLTYHQDKRW